MAISYGLSLSSLRSAHQISVEMTTIAGRLGLFTGASDPDDLLADGLTTRHGTWIRVTIPTSRPWDLVRESFGFTPTVTVSFRLDREADLRRQQDDMIQLVMNLLSGDMCDAVLNFRDGDESILLLRRDGRLTVNGHTDFWTPERLAMIPETYTLDSLSWAE